MTITMLILLWVCRIAATIWLGFFIVDTLFFENRNISRTEKITEPSGAVIWQTKKLTFLERQVSIWFNRLDPCASILMVLVLVVSVVVCVLLWLNL